MLLELVTTAVLGFAAFYSHKGDDSLAQSWTDTWSKLLNWKRLDFSRFQRKKREILSRYILWYLFIYY